jgi:hypothetical protein
MILFFYQLWEATNIIKSDFLRQVTEFVLLYRGLDWVFTFLEMQIAWEMLQVKYQYKIKNNHLMISISFNKIICG